MQSPVLCKGLRGLKGGVPVNSKKSGMSLFYKKMGMYGITKEQV